jgi:hypothetical protein
MTDDDRKTILARRARFIAAALATAGIATSSAPACGGETDDQKARSDAGVGGSAEGTGGAPQPCLGALPDGGTGGEPLPCLDVPATGGQGGAGGEGGENATGGSGGVPTVCLSAP